MVTETSLAHETFWTNKAECDDAEKKYYQGLYGNKSNPSSRPGSIAAEIAKARQHIKESLACVDNADAMVGNEDLVQKVSKLEIENKDLKNITHDLKSLVLKLEDRIVQLEKRNTPPASSVSSTGKASKVEAADEDEDVDLFGSDSEDEESKAEKERVTAERLKAYHEKKSKKPALIAKTSVLLDIKPWDDETDMNKMLKAAKSIEKEGLVWGASKLVPVGYGINKLQLMCVVEDEKVSIDELCEQIAEFDDYVQSVDVAAMSKI